MKTRHVCSKKTRSKKEKRGTIYDSNRKQKKKRLQFFLFIRCKKIVFISKIQLINLH